MDSHSTLFSVKFTDRIFKRFFLEKNCIFQTENLSYYTKTIGRCFSEGITLDSKKLVVIFILVGILGFWVYWKDRRDTIHSIYPVKKIHVKIEGEIQKPGIYEVPVGSHLKDLIEVAGGLTDRARLDSFSPESELAEGQIVKIGVNK